MSAPLLIKRNNDSWCVMLHVNDEVFCTTNNNRLSKTIKVSHLCVCPTIWCPWPDNHPQETKGSWVVEKEHWTLYSIHIVQSSFVINKCMPTPFYTGTDANIVVHVTHQFESIWSGYELRIYVEVFSPSYWKDFQLSFVTLKHASSPMMVQIYSQQYMAVDKLRTCRHCRPSVIKLYLTCNLLRYK